ncbi:MAG: Ppx/GppA family phosphatase [Burkholderiales bacterium]|nr:Ppx/GppA family phosphatase [Burkholderiales bacterium]
MTSPRTLASVDLGSNSFHLQVARVVDGQIFPLDALREPVRLGAGLSADKILSAESQQRALDCLARFGQRLRGLAPDDVRAVGTNTFRIAKNIDAFVPAAEAALGFPIEVVAGREEARLIYLGVAHSLPPSRARRLVVDIGGGSTECIIGQSYRPIRLESLYMGCVSYTLRYFPDGTVTADAMQRARLAALTELEVVAHEFSPADWSQAVGSSGSARALSQIIGESSGLDEGVITLEGLEGLVRRGVRSGGFDTRDFPQVRPDRVQVLAAGLAIMCSVFEAFGIERMMPAEGAMRQGILYDMLGRSGEKDLRGVTVSQFQRRYQVDVAQATAVEQTALAILGDLDGGDESIRQQLRWAADLHELGLSVEHSGYHKHSSYILRNADMPGFSRAEQEALANLVLGHRGKLGKVATCLRHDLRRAQIVALRLAALLHRSRHPLDTVPLRLLDCDQSSIRVSLDSAWLETHPLTQAALAEEVRQWQLVGCELQLHDTPGLRRSA